MNTIPRGLALAVLGFGALLLAPFAVAGKDTDYRQFDQAAYVLDAAQAERIRDQVLKRCALSARLAENRLPWYFHYEYGLELLAAGDPQRGLEALIVAANLREESKRNSRMYGMWYTHYLPYFQIAQAHSQLGNWRCAMDAMRLSARYSEYSPSDAGWSDYSDLQKLILRHTTQS